MLVVSACGPVEVGVDAKNKVADAGAEVKVNSEQEPSTFAPTTNIEREYVGSANCKSCHEQAFEFWQQSHHALAMQTVNSDTVLGNFDNQTVTHQGEEFFFYQRDGSYFVRTNNKIGEKEEFPISHAFGVEPLQQYLIPTGKGAYQALSMAWDSRPDADGGQRWFHMYPDESIPASDPLHWTRLHQNWNYQCADCHSTNLRKGYDASSASYSTEYNEINVGCEACHGPASQHQSWASHAEGSTPDSSPAHKGFAASLGEAPIQLASCARCHSRRRVIAEGFEPGKSLYDHYVPALLDQGLYHADGQILEEVYVYGSFLQSKMHQAGVVCSNCHNPHSAELKLEGNAVCTQCHQQSPPNQFGGLQPKSYDSTEHHFHPEGSAAAQCRQCHMPAKIYMGVDERYDHSFRIPRPELSEEVGSPNVCTDCHKDKSNQWATKAIAAHFGITGRETKPHFARAFSAIQNGQPASGLLRSVFSDKDQAPIVRASALAFMSRQLDVEALEDVRLGLASSNPAMQLAALQSVELLPVGQRWEMTSRLLRDKHLAVRIEAARTLADASSSLLSEKESSLLSGVLDEYINSQELNADRPEALSNLASLAARRGKTARAEEYYRRAINLDPLWIPAYLNLADLYRGIQRDAEGGSLLATAIKRQPDVAESRHAYGLWHSRQGNKDQALVELQHASELSDSWRYAYVYAIGLNSAGRSEEAIKQLEATADENPGNVELLFALATIERDRGDIAKAMQHAQALAGVNPRDSRLEGLIKQLSYMQQQPAQ
ncbi:MAG: tetratricopeptide repeat protein [Pseudomonadales bacterium]